jgi:hypothetical protein
MRHRDGANRPLAQRRPHGRCSPPHSDDRCKCSCWELTRAPAGERRQRRRAHVVGLSAQACAAPNQPVHVLIRATNTNTPEF